MNFTFHNKRISGILAIIPEREISFLEEMKNYQFPEARSRKLMEVMGYDKRRIVEPGVCISDLATYGLQSLFERGLLRPEEIDAMIVVTHSPDYILPGTSHVIQGRLCLKQDMLCLDISQACAGFVIGLMQAFMLLEQESIRKVVLINGDILSQRTSTKDRSLYPLIGDALTLTIVERDASESKIHAVCKMDGTQREALIIPAGGLRLPCSAQTAVLEHAGDRPSSILYCQRSPLSSRDCWRQRASPRPMWTTFCATKPTGSCSRSLRRNSMSRDPKCLITSTNALATAAAPLSPSPLPQTLLEGSPMATRSPAWRDTARGLPGQRW
jgi:3-Oxoacyl-[acyl-carrier-protein (ACP)] synthase III